MNQIISIFTYWWSEDNYGQLLQAYALQEYLFSMGISSEIIQARKENHTFFDKLAEMIIKAKVGFCGSRAVSLDTSIQQEVKQRGFQEFRTRFLQFSKERYTSLQDLKKNPPAGKYYICGSDKIWATFSRDPFRMDQFDMFTLGFGSKGTPKIAYAPSIGKREIPFFAKNRFRRNLKSFQGISVREASAVTLLNDIGINDVEWVPDPTQLIGKQGYMKFIEEVPGEYEETWFFYGLSNPSYVSSRIVAEHLVATNMDFDYTGGNNNIDDLITCYPTIPQWLNHMYYAENIITNSYHGCIFCILFHKNFYYIPVLPDKKGLPDERITSLLNRYDIQGRDITTEEQLQAVLENPYKPIDWDAVDDKMQEFVQVGKDFLAKHLGEDIQ